MQPTDPLRWPVYGNPIGRWLVALAVLAAIVAVFYLVRRVVLRRAEKFAARTSTQLDDFAVTLARRTKFVVVLAIALALAAHLALVLPERVLVALERLAEVAVAVQIGLWGSELIAFGIRRYTARHHPEDGASATTFAALSYVARALLWAFILLAVLGTFGVNVTALVTGLGIGGVAIALAVQNVLGDLLGALSIVLDKPFVVGDAIQVDQLNGTVEKIGLKTTRLRAVGGEQVIIANADLLKARIRNFRRQTTRRVQLNFSVTPDTAVDAAAQVPAIVREIVEGVRPAVRFERAHLTGLTDAGLGYELVYHLDTADYTRFLDAQQRIALDLIARLRALGVTIATGTRTVVVRAEQELAEGAEEGHVDGGGDPAAVDGEPYPGAARGEAPRDPARPAAATRA